MKSLKKNAVLYLLAVIFIANILIWYMVLREERGDILTVAFLDVGQGDAIFIEAPNGNQMLIDSGGGTTALRALGEVMPFYDRSIDVVLATHPDQDHIGGFPLVFKNFDVDYFIEPGVSSDTGAYVALADSVAGEKGVEKIIARRGMKIFLSDDIFFLVLFPDRNMEGVDTNDASIVAKLVYGDTSFLFTGDSPEKIEEFLVFLDGGELKSDVLKAGHHGSKTSTSEAFLGFVSPQISIVSVGSDNRYGHPHKEVLERLSVFESAVLRTDELGTIIFESDGKTIVVSH